MKLSVHEKAVVGSSWSLFTVVAKARFYCMLVTTRAKQNPNSKFFWLQYWIIAYNQSISYLQISRLVSTGSQSQASVQEDSAVVVGEPRTTGIAVWSPIRPPVVLVGRAARHIRNGCDVRDGILDNVSVGCQAVDHVVIGRAQRWACVAVRTALHGRDTAHKKETMIIWSSFFYSHFLSLLKLTSHSFSWFFLFSLYPLIYVTLTMTTTIHAGQRYPQLTDNLTPRQQLKSYTSYHCCVWDGHNHCPVICY